MKTSLSLSNGSTEISISVEPSTQSQYVLLLAHGAGAGYDHSFLSQLAKGISEKNGTVIRFNFPYIEQGKRFPSAPTPNIETIGSMAAYAQHEYPGLPLFISGKSYGGRMSSHWALTAAVDQVQGLIYFGFPLHPPGRESKKRAEHLYGLTLPQLFIQGTRDKLADMQLIREVVHDCVHADLFVLEHADHGFKIPKKQQTSKTGDLFELLASTTNAWALKILSQIS